MDDQEDPLVQENSPAQAPLAQPFVPPTQVMMYSQLPTPPPMNLKEYQAGLFSERVGRAIR